jgi:hypothetical protein
MTRVLTNAPDSVAESLRVKSPRHHDLIFARISLDRKGVRETCESLGAVLNGHKLRNNRHELLKRLL